MKPNTGMWLLLLFISFSTAFGQNIPAVDEPLWVSMMDDPSVNYYTALKAYEDYWTTHPEPALEEEEMEAEGGVDELKRESKKEIRKDKSVQLSESEWKKKNEEETMRYNIKRFERWKRDVKPFVQEDGRILSDDEKKQIWEKQQEELKNQNK